MKSLNGRLHRLEQAAQETIPEQAAEEENRAAVVELCRETIAAIDQGFIYDYPPEKAACFLSPTSGHEYFDLCHRAHRLVSWWANATGWRSPGQSDWKAYWANTADEMKAVMVDILGVLTHEQ